jgi:hypothetical protein
LTIQQAACAALGLRQVFMVKEVWSGVWYGDGGQTRSVTELHADTVEFLDGRRD